MYTVYTTITLYASGICKKILQTVSMPTEKPRIIATLPHEIRPWITQLRIKGRNRSRMTLEGLLALRFLDDVELEQISSWPALLETEAKTWKDFESYCKMTKDQRKRCAIELMELLVSREVGNKSKPPAKRASERTA